MSIAGSDFGLEIGRVARYCEYDADDLARPDAVLRELHRVLKPGGTLSFSDHHMEEKEVIARITGPGIFKFVKRGRKTYSFAKG